MRKFLYIVLCLFLIACSAEKPEIEVALLPCAPMPSARASAACFVIHGEAYVFAGRDSAGVAQNDLWRYNPEADQWTCLGVLGVHSREQSMEAVSELPESLYRLRNGVCRRRGVIRGLWFLLELPARHVPL